MLRGIMSASLTVGLLATSWAGETTFTNVKKIPMGPLVEIEAEGTNQLNVGETFDGWIPVFVRPYNTIVPATILEFTSPAPGGNAAKFKIRYTITDPNNKDKGDWRARSTLRWKTETGGGFQVTASEKIPIP
jgi:hypothetical protein